MSEFTELVSLAVKNLEAAENGYEKAKSREDKIRNHCGQRGYSVSVNGVDIAVSRRCPRTYQGALIRGREMIHLGALKALAGLTEEARDLVVTRRKELLDVVLDQSKRVDDQEAKARGEK